MLKNPSVWRAAPMASAQRAAMLRGAQKVAVRQTARLAPVRIAASRHLAGTMLKARPMPALI